MPIKKHYPFNYKTYQHIHRTLRRKLQKQAFDNYYKCQRCGAHKDLEIHIPNCDPAIQDQPGFYSILCPPCHKLLRNT